MAKRVLPDGLRDGIFYYSRRAREYGVANLCSGAWTEPSALTPVAQLGAERAAVATYPSPNGDEELRCAVAASYCGLDPRNVTVTPGATGALLVAMSLSARPGDEILFPTPAYAVTATAARLAGLTPRPVAAWTLKPDRTQWRLDVDRLAHAITPRTAALVVADPDNPTGAVLGGDDWRALIELCRTHDLQLIVDRVYQEYVYSRPLYDASALVAEGAFVASSVSKSFHCAGLRVGWLLAPQNAEDALGEAVVSFFGGVAAPAQATAADALKLAARAALDAERANARALHDLLVARLEREDIGAVRAQGGLFVNVPATALGVSSSAAAWRALIQRGLGGVPSSEFLFGADDADPFVRLCFARTPDLLSDPSIAPSDTRFKRSAS